MYCIHTDKKRLEVYEYPREIMEADLKYFRVTHYKQLETHDFRIFKTEREAELFLSKYKLTERSLLAFRHVPKQSMPGMLYPRRFLVLAKMGVKLSTIRHYKKPWRVGTVFRFYDQTYFIVCKLKSITKHEKGYKYEYAVL